MTIVLNENEPLVVKAKRLVGEDLQEVEVLHIQVGDNVKISAFDTDVNIESTAGNVNLKSDSDVNIEGETSEVNIKGANSVNLSGKVDGQWVKHTSLNADGSGSFANGNITFDADGNLSVASINSL